MAETQNIVGVWPLDVAGPRSLFKREYVYLDTNENLADKLFIKHKVKVEFVLDMHHPDEWYKLVLIRFPKRDEQTVRDALSELYNTHLICGNTDYLDFCKEMDEIVQAIKNGEGEIVEKEVDD